MQLVILCKIECDNNDGDIKFLTENTNSDDKNKFIILLEIIFGCYISHETDNPSVNNIQRTTSVNKQVLSAIGTIIDINIKKIKDIKTSLTKDKEQLKLDIKELFTNIKYEDLCKKIDFAQKLIKQYNILTLENKTNFAGFTQELQNMDNISNLIEEIKDNENIDFANYFT